MADPGSALSPDSFWSTVKKRSQSALHTGALQPISTHTSIIEDEGIDFVVRITDNLLRKPGTRSSYLQSRKLNPFLPPDTELTIGYLPPHHVAVLNKFNVLNHHVLVVTHGFVHQESPLTAADFSAVATGLKHDGSLAFYNGGKLAGASQLHKHFQLVPPPLGGSSDIPMAVLFDKAENGINTIESLRFQHAFSLLGADPSDPAAFGYACHNVYARALRELEVVEQFCGDEETRLPPYNLLLTKRWLFIAPRRTEHYLDISVNGLGYAGSLFVSSPDKLEQVKSAGPMTILETVSITT
ncbi:MAG: hypothetical protein MAG794_00483 [Gammaproteobacteria bacterium]|nr:hypothetical protein [Gammaproteobacteria bacterium]